MTAHSRGHMPKLQEFFCNAGNHYRPVAEKVAGFPPRCVKCDEKRRAGVRLARCAREGARMISRTDLAAAVRIVARDVSKLNGSEFELLRAAVEVEQRRRAPAPQMVDLGHGRIVGYQPVRRYDERPCDPPPRKP